MLPKRTCSCMSVVPNPSGLTSPDNVGMEPGRMIFPAFAKGFEAVRPVIIAARETPPLPRKSRRLVFLRVSIGRSSIIYPIFPDDFLVQFNPEAWLFRDIVKTIPVLIRCRKQFSSYVIFSHRVIWEGCVCQCC